MTPGLLYAVAVGVAGMAVALVVFGVGYLLGRRVMQREVIKVLEPLSWSSETARRDFTVLKGLVQSR